MSPPLPTGMIDTHHHIFDPTSHAYSKTRHLTPPKASVEDYKRFKQEHSISRSVLVHGLSYGHDCSSLNAFIQDLDSHGTRGVAVISRETTDDELNLLHQAGVRGIRMDFYHESAMRDLGKQKELLRWYADRIKPWGWSLAFLQLEPKNWAALKPLIQELPVNVVIDHHALLKAESLHVEGQDIRSQQGFDAILEMLGNGKLWIKISAPYRCSDQAPFYEDMRVIVRALVEANPRRVVWGSDWPHTPRMALRTQDEALKERPFLEVNDRAWLESLRSWLSPEEWQLVMVVNPTALYFW